MWNRKAKIENGEDDDDVNDHRTDEIAARVGDLLLKQVLSKTKKLHLDFVCARVANGLENSECHSLRMMKVQSLGELINRVVKSRAQVTSFELVHLLRDVKVDDIEGKQSGRNSERKSNSYI